MALNISLNGSNYVSDKTRGAFEQALQEARIKNQRISESANQPTTHPPQPITHNPQLLTPNSQLLETLDHALAQSFEHQTLTMRVHEQYLNNQGDYAQLFGQLMEQQGAIFAQGAATPQQAEITASVLETLARSMARFHDLQEQTLDVHKQFLAQQSDYAHATIQLLANQRISESANQRISESANQRVSESVNQRISESVNQRIDEAAERGNGNGHHPQEAENSKLKTRSLKLETGSSIQHPTLNVSQPVSSTGHPVSSIQYPVSSNSQPTTLVPSLLAIVSDKTGYPTDMLELDMDMEADLGIDSIKRVEILGALQDAHPDLPEVPTDVLAEMRTLRQIVEKMQEAGGKNQESADRRIGESANQRVSELAHNSQPTTLVSSLLAIVSDKTGYPTDMLELDMDMEADLGIDSIKRVEILGALQDAHPDLPEVPTDVLAEMRTLRQIVEKMQEAGGKKPESANQRIGESADPEPTTHNPQPATLKKA